MPYVTRAAWEFRGAASAAAKRNSVVGSYTLTESGTPSYSTAGVNFSASTSDRLALTLPVELRIGFVWTIGGFRVTGSNPGGDAHAFSLMLNDTVALDISLGFLRAPNGQSFSKAAFGGSSFGGTNHGVIPTATDVTFAIYKTALGVNNPGFRGRLSSSTWQSFFTYNAGIDYTATSRLVFGSTNSFNANLEMQWFAMGDGDITEAELDAISANPSLVLGGGGTNKFRPHFITG
jgi:hypothetical protein